MYYSIKGMLLLLRGSTSRDLGIRGRACSYYGGYGMDTKILTSCHDITPTDYSMEGSY